MLLFILLFIAGFIHAAPQNFQALSQPQKQRCHLDNVWWGTPGQTITGEAWVGSKIPCEGGFYALAVWDDGRKNSLTSSLSAH